MRLLPLLFALAPAAALAEPVAYKVDASHTEIQFEVSHMGFSTSIGRFDQAEVTLRFDPEQPADSSVEASIDVASIDTGVAKLDEHLKSDDFFNAAEHPTMGFRSTGVRETGENRLAVDGEFTLLGVTRPLTLDVTINQVGPHPFHKRPTAGFSATATLDRTAFGMDKYAPDVVGSEVRIRIEAEASVPAAE